MEKGEKMRLTKEEKEICEAYRKRDENNTVHCFECPLVINVREFICKANCTRKEWGERKEE